MNAPGNSAPTITTNSDVRHPALVLLAVSCPGQKAGAPTAHNHPSAASFPPATSHSHSSLCLGVTTFERSPVLLTFLLL